MLENSVFVYRQKHFFPHDMFTEPNKMCGLTLIEICARTNEIVVEGQI
jgi:hypothetical protein